MPEVRASGADISDKLLLKTRSRCLSIVSIYKIVEQNNLLLHRKFVKTSM
jgi:hypothetical protein